MCWEMAFRRYGTNSPAGRGASSAGSRVSIFPCSVESASVVKSAVVVETKLSFESHMAKMLPFFLAGLQRGKVEVWTGVGFPLRRVSDAVRVVVSTDLRNTAHSAFRAFGFSTRAATVLGCCGGVALPTNRRENTCSASLRPHAGGCSRDVRFCWWLTHCEPGCGRGDSHK